MTTKQAINLLKRISYSQHDSEKQEALEMAVRALEQNLVKESGDLVQDLVKDCISREAAIEVVEEYADRLQMVDWKENPGVPYKVHALNWCINSLRELPSAQPETHDKRTETHECDLINRQQAIDIVRNRVKRFTTACVLAVTEIEKLPPAQPERNKGKWIWWYEEEFTEHATEYTPHCKCSECGRECAPSVATSSNFCRNCGARME